MLEKNRAPFITRHPGPTLSAKRTQLVQGAVHNVVPHRQHKITNSGWGILADPLFLDKFPGYGLFNWEKFRRASYEEAQRAKTRLSLRDIKATLN